MEGSFWRLGCDLGDIYTGAMTLRQMWLRVNDVAQDPHSPMARALRAAQVLAEEQERAAALDDVLTRYQPKG